VPTEEFVVTEVLRERVDDVSEAWLEFDDIDETLRILLASSRRKAVNVWTFVVARRTGADILGLSTFWTEKLLIMYGISPFASRAEGLRWRRFVCLTDIVKESARR
jgi:hypothetical protein